MLSVIVPTYNSEKTIEFCLQVVKKSEKVDFELIVVDDGSLDATISIAKKYADKLIEHPKNLGRGQARNAGVASAQGEILVFIDSDVVVKDDSLSIIKAYFLAHSEVDALCGMLSKEHPNPDFLSQYKNLYMNYIFSKLPERINFLYGSIHAIRREAVMSYGEGAKIADDTEQGQKLSARGNKIAFLKDLQVVHLKKYTFLSFVKNDFQIPYEWVKIFLRYKGWNEIGKNKGGYLHSPKEQLVSVVLAPIDLLLLGAAIWVNAILPLFGVILAAWFFLNLGFFSFLLGEKGLVFGMFSVFVTFIDHLIMAAGIVSGFLAGSLCFIKRKSTNL